MEASRRLRESAKYPRRPKKQDPIGGGQFKLVIDHIYSFSVVFLFLFIENCFNCPPVKFLVVLNSFLNIPFK